jgi:hypothetical protein
MKTPGKIFVMRLKKCVVEFTHSQINRYFYKQTNFKMEITAENTSRQLLSSFYEKHDLEKDGGLGNSKVKIVMTKNFYLYLPNSDTRRKALLKHDIHHLITGYKSDFAGEMEISSWEIASGCNGYIAAWILNLWGMLYGFWFNLPKVFKAFIRGKRSKNLYSNAFNDETALDIPIGQLRSILQIPLKEESFGPKFVEVLSFILWMFIASLFSIASILLVPLLLGYNLYLLFTGKF